MREKVVVFYPNVKDKDQYYQIEGKLTENAALLALVAPDAAFAKDVAVHMAAKAVFDRFVTFANEHNRAGNMYMTQEEIRRELSDHPALDDAIKYLLERDYIKQEYRDISET